MFSRFMMTLPAFIGQFFKFALIVAIIGATSRDIGQLLPGRIFTTPTRLRALQLGRGGHVLPKFKIQFWKDKVPDMSQYVKSMFRKKISVFRDFDYINELVLETCVAEFVHWMLVLISPIFLVLMEGIAGWIGTILYALGNLPFVMIQRYNRPRLVRLMTLQKRQDLANSLQ